MVDFKATADKAYGAWNTAAEWVAAHPKTAIAAALAVIVLVVWLMGR